jgi:hypothetical protein
MVQNLCGYDGWRLPNFISFLNFGILFLHHWLSSGIRIKYTIIIYVSASVVVQGRPQHDDPLVEIIDFIYILFAKLSHQGVHLMSEMTSQKFI